MFDCKIALLAPNSVNSNGIADPTRSVFCASLSLVLVEEADFVGSAIGKRREGLFLGPAYVLNEKRHLEQHD
jgi:hypothetical protein